jgi:hypothetical protein
MLRAHYIELTCCREPLQAVSGLSIITICSAVSNELLMHSLFRISFAGHQIGR